GLPDGPRSLCPRRAVAKRFQRRERDGAGISIRRGTRAPVASALGVLDDRDRAEAFGLQRGAELPLVADEHDRRPLGLDVLARDALDLTRRDTFDRAAVAGALGLLPVVHAHTRPP